MPLPDTIALGNDATVPRQIIISGAGTTAANGVYNISDTTAGAEVWTQLVDADYTISRSSPDFILAETIAGTLYEYDPEAGANKTYPHGSGWTVTGGSGAAPTSVVTPGLPATLTP